MIKFILSNFLIMAAFSLSAIETPACSLEMGLQKIESQGLPPTTCLTKDQLKSLAESALLDFQRTNQDTYQKLHLDPSQFAEDLIDYLWLGKILAVQSQLRHPSEPFTLEQLIRLTLEAKLALISSPHLNLQARMHFLHHSDGNATITTSTIATPKELLKQIKALKFPPTNNPPILQLLMENEGFLFELFPEGYIWYDTQEPGLLVRRPQLQPYETLTELLKDHSTIQMVLIESPFIPQTVTAEATLSGLKTELAQLQKVAQQVQEQDTNRIDPSFPFTLKRQQDKLQQIQQALDNIKTDRLKPKTLEELNLLLITTEALKQVNDRAILDDQRTRSLKAFIASPATPLDEKLFLHVLGDAFGYGTNLEGDDPIRPLKYRLELFKSKLARLPQDDPKNLEERKLLERFVKKMEEALVVRNMMSQIFGSFQKEFGDWIRNLQVGESTFWPGGWHQPSHAIYFEVVKQTSELLTLRLYNTGLGQEFHPTGPFKGQRVVLPRERADIPIGHFLNPVTLAALWELYQLPDSAPDDLYLAFLRQLGGNEVGRPCKNELVPQISGTCPYRSLEATLRWQTDDQNLALRLDWETAFKALVDFMQLHQNQLQTQELVNRLANRNLIAFAQLTKQRFDDEVLLTGELQYASKVIHELLTRLSQEEAAISQKVRQSSPDVHIRPSLGLDTFSLPKFPPPQDFTKQREAFPNDYLAIDTSKFDPKPDTLAHDLENDLQRIKKIQETSQTLELNEAIAEIVQRLPFPQDSSFWAVFDPNQVDPLLEQLLDLGKEHLHAIIKANQAQPHREFQLQPKTYLVQTKLLVLTDFLIRTFKKEPLRLYQRSLELFFGDNGSRYFHLMDPEWDRQFVKMRAYWYSVYDRHQWQESFFGVETYPAVTWDTGRHVWETTDLKEANRDNYHDKRHEWSDVVWATDWVQKPEVTKSIHLHYPMIANKSPAYQAVFAMSDQFDDAQEGIRSSERPTILPRFFFIARDLSLSLNYLLQGSLSHNTDWVPNRPLFTIDTVRVSASLYPPLRMVWHLKAIVMPEKWSGIEEENLENKEDLRKNTPLFVPEDTHFKLTSSTLPDENLWEVYTENRNEHRLNKLYWSDVNQFFHIGLPLDETRKLLSLSVVKELQIQELFGYFAPRSYLLTKPSYQTYFKWMLFEPGLLDQELSQEPEASAQLVNRLVEWISTNVALYRNLGDFETVNFFLYINDALQKNILLHQELQPKDFPPDYRAPFLNTRAIIRELLAKSPQMSSLNQARFYRTLALSYVNAHLDADGLTELLKAVIYYHAHSLQLNDREETIAIRDLLRSHRLAIEQLVKGPDGRPILNAVYHFFYPENHLPIWNEASPFPSVIGQRGQASVIFHLLEGTLFDGGNPVFLPSSITQELIFQQLMGIQESYAATLIAPGVFELSSPTGTKLRIFAQTTGVPKFQREIKGRWYEQVTEDASLKNRSLIVGHSHWYIDKPHPEIAIYRDQDNHPVALIEEGKIFQLNAQGEKTGRVLLNLYEKVTPFQFLDHFEDLSFVRVWQNALTSTPELVELPRFGLLFDVKAEEGELRLISRQLFGYRIAPKQYVEPLGDLTHYLLLVNKEGQQLVLIPRQLLNKSEEESSLTTTAIPLRDLVQETDQRYLIYRYDPETRQLQPESQEGRFYLALLALWEHRYEWANTLLQGYGLSGVRLKDSEKQLLEAISNLRNVNRDAYPLAIALRQKARSLLSEENVIEAELDPSPANPTLSQPEASSAQASESADKADKIVNKILSPDKNTETIPSHLSRPQLSPLFLDLYRLAKGEGNSLTMKTTLEKMTGVELTQNISSFQVKKIYYSLLKTIESLTGLELTSHPMTPEEAFRQTLGFMTRSSPQNKNEPLLAGYLVQVLNHPEKFPSGDEVEALLTKAALCKKSPWNCRPHFESANDAVKKVQTALKLLENLPNEPQPLPILSLDTICPIPPEAETKDQRTHEAYEQCLKLQEEMWHEHLSLKPLESYLTTSPGIVTPADADIRTLFQLKQGDALLKADFDSRQAALLTFWNKASAPSYELADPKGLLQALTPQIAALKSRSQQEKEALLWLANHQSKNPTQRAYETVALAGKAAYPLTLDDLIHLFLKRDFARYQKLNPALSLKDIEVLSERTMSYLIDTIALHQFEAVEKLAQAVQKETDAHERSLRVQELAATLLAKRTYSYIEHPEYLVFEYTTGFLLRPVQVSALDQLMIQKGQIGNIKGLGAVLEMIMGSGKTAVLLPLVAILMAHQGHLALAIMPEELMPSKIAELEKPLGQSFQQSIQVIEVNRQTPLDTPHLQLVLGKLKHAQEEGRLVMMTNSSLQSLYLHFLARLDTLTHPNPPFGLSEEADLFRQIFRFLKEQGQVIVDEVDAVFDVLRSHHFTLQPAKEKGKNQDRLESATVHAVLAFYQVLATQQLDLPLNFLRTGEQREALKGFQAAYANGGKKRLIDALIGQLVKTAWAEATESDRRELTHYLEGDPDKTLDLFPDQIQDTLAVWHEELNQVFPLTAVKNLHTHYGPILNPGKRQDPDIAIPYHLGSPSGQSLFGTDLEQLNYLLQMYLEMGISEKIVQDEIDRLQALDPKRTDIEIYQASPLFALLQELGLSLQHIQPSEITLLTKRVNEKDNLPLQWQLIQLFVIPQIRVFSKQVDSNAQVYALLFDKIQGFSGTLWNYRTFPAVFTEPSLSDTMERTLKALWKPESMRSRTLVVTGEKERLTQLIQQIYGLGDPSIPKGSFVDTAGLFRGIDNGKVAQAILELPVWKDTPIRGVVFYQDNVLTVLSQEEGGLKHTPIHQSHLKKEERIAFWDQEHWVGSDIPLSTSMTAAVSVGQHTLMRDLLQAVWRLRKLDRGQSVHFVVEEEDRVVMNDVLLKAFGEVSSPLSLKDILRYVEYHEAERRGEQNFRAFRHKMGAIYAHDIYDQMLDPNRSIDAVVNLYGQTQALFGSERNGSPRLRYGKPHKLLSRAEAIQQVRNRLNNKIHLFKDLIKTDPLEKMQTLIDNESPYFPEWIQSTGDYEQEVAVETEMEQETSLQQQQETQASRFSFNVYLLFQPGFTWANLGFNRLSYTPQSVKKVAEMIVEGTRSNDYATGGELERPLVGVKDALEQEQIDPELSQLFDSDLLISFNMMPIYKIEDGFDFTPFGMYQKSVTQALVIQDKQSGKVQLVLLDVEEAKQFEAFLAQDYRQPAEGPRDVRLALYHLGTGIYRQGAESIDPIDLEKDPHFIRLKVQAKFFNGDSRFSKAEQPILKAWLKESGQKGEKLRELFTTIILKWKSSSYEEFVESPLEQIMQDLNQ